MYVCARAKILLGQPLTDLFSQFVCLEVFCFFLSWGCLFFILTSGHDNVTAGEEVEMADKFPISRTFNKS